MSEKNVTMESKVRQMLLEDNRRGPEARDGGNLQKLEKTGKPILPQRHGRSTTMMTP